MKASKLGREGSSKNASFVGVVGGEGNAVGVGPQLMTEMAFCARTAIVVDVLELRWVSRQHKTTY
jgi:hypothetical protein